MRETCTTISGSLQWYCKCKPAANDINKGSKTRQNTRLKKITRPLLIEIVNDRKLLINMYISLLQLNRDIKNLFCQLLYIILSGNANANL